MCPTRALQQIAMMILFNVPLEEDFSTPLCASQYSSPLTPLTCSFSDIPSSHLADSSGRDRRQRLPCQLLLHTSDQNSNSATLLLSVSSWRQQVSCRTRPLPEESASWMLGMTEKSSEGVGWGRVGDSPRRDPIIHPLTSWWSQQLPGLHLRQGSEAATFLLEMPRSRGEGWNSTTWPSDPPTLLLGICTMQHQLTWKLSPQSQIPASGGSQAAAGNTREAACERLGVWGGGGGWNTEKHTEDCWSACWGTHFKNTNNNCNLLKHFWGTHFFKKNVIINK